MTSRSAITWGAAAGLAATVVGVFAVLVGVDLLPLLGLVAAVGVLAVAAGLAFRHYATLVLLLVVVRPELDAVGHATGPGLGLIFLVGSAWWLFTRWRHDCLVPPTPAAWGLLALVGAAAVSTLSSHVPVVSASGTASLAAGVLMFVVVEQLVRSGMLPTKALHVAVAASAVLVCGHVALQMGYDSAPVDESIGLSRVTGPFVHASVLGKYTAIVAVLMVARAVWTRSADRLLWGVGAAATCGVTLLTYTRAAWLAAALGVLVLAYRRDRRWLPVIVVVAVVGIIVTPSLKERVMDVWDPGAPPPGAPESSLAWRVEYWQALLPLGWLNPTNGIGLDVVPTMRSEGLLPHNVWVQTWVELGLLGLVALVAAVATTTITLRRAGRASLGRSGERRASYEAALAVAVGLGLVTISENLLAETTTLWYAAVVMAAGWSPLDGDGDDDVGREEEPWWLSRTGWRERRPRVRRGAPTPR